MKIIYEILFNRGMSSSLTLYQKIVLIVNFDAQRIQLVLKLFCRESLQSRYSLEIIDLSILWV